MAFCPAQLPLQCQLSPQKSSSSAASCSEWNCERTTNTASASSQPSSGSLYPTGRLVGGDHYKPILRERSPSVMWKIEENSSTSSIPEQSHDLSHLCENNQPGQNITVSSQCRKNGGISYTGHPPFDSALARGSSKSSDHAHSCKDYYLEWKAAKGIRKDSAFSKRKAYSAYLIAHPPTENLQNMYNTSGINQPNSRIVNASALGSMCPPATKLSSANRCAYSSSFSDCHPQCSPQNQPEFDEATFTCPSCCIRHWRPGLCTFCSKRPSEPVLLYLPWKSSNTATGFNLNTTLHGRKCVLNLRDSDLIGLPATAYYYMTNHGNILSWQGSEYISPPCLNVSEVLCQARTSSMKLPSITDDPPILCASGFKPGVRNTSSTSSNLSEYFDARSACMLKLREKSVRREIDNFIFLINKSRGVFSSKETHSHEQSRRGLS